jgi:hypothetical protein
VSCGFFPPFDGAKPMPPEISSDISRAPRFEVITSIVFEKSTRRLSPKVSVALSRMPSRSCHRLSEAFSISSKRTSESLVSSVW